MFFSKMGENPLYFQYIGESLQVAGVKKIEIKLNNNIKPIRSFIMAKYSVTDDCISCGICADECPECITLEDKAVFKKQPEGTTEIAKAEAAKDACPVSAIVAE